MKLIRDFGKGIITFIGGRKKLSISAGGCQIKDIPIELIREAIEKMEYGQLIAKAERIRNLYRSVLMSARGDAQIIAHRDYYLAIQGVVWEAIQEIRQELPLVDEDTREKLGALLERIEDSNHRVDAVMATRLGVMSEVADETRGFLEGKEELPSFMSKVRRAA
jgi:hypothetical protein